MEKIKKFVKDNKEIVIASIIGAGVAVAGKAMYDIGVTKGMKIASTAWIAMMNADTDGTLTLRDHIVTNFIDENDMKDFVEFGHEMLKGVKKGVGL